MRKYKLKGPHCVYLLAMSHEPAGVTAPQLCELCGKDKSDVSRMMGILEKKGMVVKEGIYQKQYDGVFKLEKKPLCMCKSGRAWQWSWRERISQKPSGRRFMRRCRPLPPI